MTNEEWFELIEARMNEIMNGSLGLCLMPNIGFCECLNAAKELVGVRIWPEEAKDRYFDVIAIRIHGRCGRGVMTLDEAVTHLNNLPLGLRIADLQRAEVLEDEPELMPAEVAPGVKSLEQLCDEYEESVCSGKQSIEAQAYIMALEDLVSEMQGKSFADSSRIGKLEAENAVLKCRPSTAEDIQLGNDIDALYGIKR